MARVDPLRAAARFDRYLDALAAGDPPAGRGLDPGLLSAAERLHRAAGLPVRRFAPVRSATPAFTAGWERGAPGATGRSGVRAFRPMTLVSTAALFALIVAGVLFTIVAPHRHAANAPEFWIYAVDYEHGRIVELDRETLQPTDRVIRSFPPVPRGQSSDVWYGWTLSSDGSTLLETRTPSGMDQYGFQPGPSITVFDTATGTQRTAIDTSADYWPALSADGSRMVLSKYGIFYVRQAGPGGSEPIDWQSYDARTGELLGTTSSLLTRPDFDGGVLSPDGRTAFVLVASPAATGTGPWPTDLAIVDLIAGGEPRIVEIPGLLTGRWSTGMTTSPGACNLGPDGKPIAEDIQLPVETYASASVAVAPDGRTVAVVSPDGVTVTLVDVASGAVARTLTAATPVETTSASVDRCTFSTGRIARVTYLDGGDALLLTGSRSYRSGDTVSEIDLGLRRVDASTGWTIAVSSQPPAPGRARWENVLRAGQASVVLSSSEWTSPFNVESSMLRLLDATTLATKLEVDTGLAWGDYLVSPRRLAPLAPEPPPATPVGATSVVVRALGGDVDRVTITVDGEAVFDGPLANRAQTRVFSGVRITITSSNPEHTAVVVPGGQIRMMREPTEIYPRS